MFKETKTSHLAAYILHLMGGEMLADDLMRMLYLMDRESYRTRAYPITGDIAEASASGPVLRTTRSLLLGCFESEHWERFISPVSEDNKVTLVTPIGLPVFYTTTEPNGSTTENVVGYTELGHLSAGNRVMAESVVANYRAKEAWTPDNMANEFPEMQDATGYGKSIPVPSILRVVGYSEDAIGEIMEDLDDREEHERLSLLHAPGVR